MKRRVLLVVSALLLSACGMWPQPAPALWADVAQADAPQRSVSELRTNPGVFRLLRLHEKTLAAALANVPDSPDDTSASVLNLPKPSGGFERFRIWRSATQSLELQAEMDRSGWPIRTYAGVSLDRPATSLSMDWGGPEGFHAAVLGPEDDYYIDPRYRSDRGYYVCYRKKDLPVPPRSSKDQKGENS